MNEQMHEQSLLNSVNVDLCSAEQMKAHARGSNILMSVSRITENVFVL